jgi:hypothetical protein
MDLIVTLHIKDTQHKPIVHCFDNSDEDEIFHFT